MEVFMHNVNWNCNTNQVITALGVILHGPRFSDLSPVPINFHVHLHNDKKRLRKHGGTGTLTLPSQQFGNRFLELYGSDPPVSSLVLEGKIVKFKPSDRPKLRADVLEIITRLPYVDPIVLEARKRRVAQIDATIVDIKTIQFGWECRDQTFSIESEEKCEGRCILTFDSERRELRIKLNQPPDTFIIAMKYSQINYTTAHNYLNEEPIIFFSLNTPPTYERDGKPLRQRLSYLPIPDHQRVAPYASLAIRLVCCSQSGLLTFLNCSKTAQLHNIYDYEYPVVRLELFSSDKLETLQKWLRHFNWCVTFQIEALVRSMAIDIAEALGLMPVVDRVVKTKGKEVAASMLRKFHSKAKHMFWDTEEEVDLRQCFLGFEKECDMPTLSSSLKPSEGSLRDVFHVMITPTTMFLEGPFPERSNRVIRMYELQHQESFLRVSFVDEGKLQYRFDREIDGANFIRSRVGPFLLEGLTIAKRQFRFLAYSQSALKEHAVWFVKPFKDKHRGLVNATTIINGLGDFNKLDERLVYCPARYAARLSQAFTATDAVSVEVEEILPIGDISTADNKYHFTDGVGTLSPELAREIWTQLKSTKRRARSVKTFPSAFQIRFMGSKGMLSVDYRLSGNATICLRPSMIKFEAPNSREIEIARAFDRPGPYFLNRPLIMLLEGLGVPYDVFKRYQDMAVLETRRAGESLKQAATMLDNFGLGSSYRLPSILLSLDKLGISSFPNNAFYEKMLEYAINHVLRQLKNNARIPVPKAWTLVGVADVHAYLEPNEIFACVKPIKGGTIYLEGPVLISRSPTIHPGDVMLVNAIGSPPRHCPFAKEPLSNTVVFSILGDRPVPSCLGGGDLDGDVYNLIPLNELPEFRPTQFCGPAKYDPAPKKEVDHPSTMEDVADFVMEYINSDVVGIVAINWLIIADQSPKGIFDEDCLTLANLHSNAVDYPKSGQPVSMKAIPKLRSTIKPDWNAPETVNANSDNYYESKRAIGRLFRAIDLPIEARPDTRQPRSQRKAKRRRAEEDLIEKFAHFDLDSARDDPVIDVVADRVEDFIDTYGSWEKSDVDSIKQLFERYTSELHGICAANTLSHARTALLSEEEAIIGTIVQKSSQPRKRKDMMSSLRESTDVLVRAIREELSGDDDLHEKSLERAWMAWQLSCAAGKTFGAQSFGWVALGAIFESIREIEERDEPRVRRSGLRS